ncbi:MAG: ABC transporter ATP-binding protein [bacterium]
MSTTKKTLQQIWQDITPYRLLFFIAAIFPIFAVICVDILAPFVVSRAFSKIQTTLTTGGSIKDFNFTPYIIIFLILMIAGLVIWRIQAFASHKIQAQLQRDQIVKIFNHLQHQGSKFHADSFGGSLVSQAFKYTSATARLFDELFYSVISGITAIVASLIILFIVSFKFAVVFLAIMSVYIVAMIWRIKIQFPYNRRESEQETLRTAALADAVTNTGNIRAFGREDYELKRFKSVAKNAYKAMTDLSSVSLTNDTMSDAMTYGLQFIAFAFGLIAVVKLNANAGVLYLVIAYTSSLVQRLWVFTRVVKNINRSFGDSTQMTEILQLENEIQDPKEPVEPAIRRGSIEFKDVSFKHSGASKTLFENLNLRIKQGEKIGLVGPSGGGKTTLTSLLMRFNDIDSGEILVDGINIASIKQIDLRDHISYVPQEPLLFHRSIKENIGYGQLDSDDQAIEGVAKMAHAHEFVKSLPQGYDTLVGERGVKLSGGQRQRITIARAMLKNAPILVLDEATSALDSESEVLIQDALWKLMEKCTTIIIAHRLSTIQKMDRIIVLDKGQIAEEGSHNELLRKNGIYAKLWAHQSGGFLES